MLIQEKDKMNDIKIRRATVADVEAIASLGKCTFEESYGDFFNNQENLSKYLNKSFSLEKIKNSLEKTENVYWIVYDQKELKPIGYAKLKLNSPSEFIDDKQYVCKLQRIYLRQGYEGQGIGSKLHEVILEYATRLGYKNLWLSNLKLKKQAVSFYKKKGYAIAGEHPFTIGNQEFDFWVMNIRLG